MDIATWIYRAIGVLYFAGGMIGLRMAWFSLRAEPMMDDLIAKLDEFSAEAEGRAPAPKPKSDTGRNWWLLFGTALLAPTGIAMALAHWSSVALLAIIVVHQLLYFTRQRLRELKARTAGDAAEARPERSTVNAFFMLLVVAVFGAWLYSQGALT